MPWVRGRAAAPCWWARGRRGAHMCGGRSPLQDRDAFDSASGVGLALRRLRQWLECSEEDRRPETGGRGEPTSLWQVDTVYCEASFLCCAVTWTGTNESFQLPASSDIKPTGAQSKRLPGLFTKMAYGKATPFLATLPQPRSFCVRGDQYNQQNS